MRLTPEIAAGFAQTTLSHLGRQYPYKLDLILNGPEDAVPPIALHPIFHGSFDWHSCVHGWWQVLRIARLFPDLPEAVAIRARADAMLTPEKVAGEVARLDRPDGAMFERPYGWAWLLALHGEAVRHDAGWAAALELLANRFAALFPVYLAKLTYPVRTGTHANTSFALTLTLEWARQFDPDLAETIASRALAWFDEDHDCQAWEPGGDEFLSSALSEALLMSAVVEPAEFAGWFDAFLPEAAARRPATLFNPARISDRSDGKVAHLDGLNLSRAWAWRGIAAALGDDHPIASVAHATADAHIAASLPHIADDYVGSHWLASFALLALEARS